MLGKQVLDAARHPFVTVNGRFLESRGDRTIVRATLHVRGAAKQIEVPVKVRGTDDQLVATGTMTLRQTEFGIEPFSVLGGALVVRDELSLEFSITARAKE